MAIHSSKLNPCIFFLYQGQTEGQQERISGQITGQTFSSCDKSVYGDIEGTNATESDEVHKVLKSVLTSHFADLSNQLSMWMVHIQSAIWIASFWDPQYRLH